MNSIDIRLFHFFNFFAGRSKIADAIIIFFASYLPYIVLLGFLWITFSVGGDMFAYMNALLAVTIAMIVTKSIHYFYHRPRPFLNIQAKKLLLERLWFYSDTDGAFPSGHATFFFALGVALFLMHAPWAAWFIGGAAVISLSRIIAGVHYPSDILGGMIIGILSASATFLFF